MWLTLTVSPRLLATGRVMRSTLFRIASHYALKDFNEGRVDLIYPAGGIFLTLMAAYADRRAFELIASS